MEQKQQELAAEIPSSSVQLETEDPPRNVLQPSRKSLSTRLGARRAICTIVNITCTDPNTDGQSTS